MRAHIEPEELKGILTPAEIAEIPVNSLGIITRNAMAKTILQYEREARYEGIKRSRRIAAELKAVLAGAMAGMP
jgi:hypothetical protein